MDYKIFTYAEINDYFSTNTISEWYFLNVYIDSKLESNPFLTASELFRSFCKSLTFIKKNENYSYPKYISKYAKKLRIAIKVNLQFANKSHFL